MAESERYLPTLIDKVEKIMEESGLRNNSIVMRMTGCPNGCARESHPNKRANLATDFILSPIGSQWCYESRPVVG